MSTVYCRLRGIFNAPVSAAAAAAATGFRQSTASSKEAPTSKIDATAGFRQSIASSEGAPTSKIDAAAGFRQSIASSKGGPTTKTDATAKGITSTVNGSARSNVAMAKRRRKLQNRVNKFKKLSESPEFRNNRRNFYRIIRHLATSKQFSMVVDVLEHQKNFEDVTSEWFFVRMMRFYGKAGMFEHARKLFDEMSLMKVTPTNRSFNTLLFAGNEAGKFDEVDGLFKELPAQVGITPDVVSYNIVIKARCELDNADIGVSMLEEMERKGVEPDSITFNTLLNSFYGKGRFDDGEKIWALMEKKNVIPNVRSYNARIRGWLSEKTVEEAIDIFYEMEGKGIKPDPVSYNEVIRYFCSIGNVEKANQWYRKLENYCKPDCATYVTMLPFLCSKGEFDMALLLCKEAISNRMFLRAEFFQPVVDGLVKESRIEEANDLLELGKSKKYFWYKLNFPSVE